MVGHNYRREAGYRQLKRWLDDGRLGTVIDAQCESSHAGGLRLEPNTWRFDPTLCPALPLIQLGVHLVDLCNLCFGRPVDVTALMRHRAIPGENADATMTLIGYEGGVLVSVASHYCTPGRSEILVSGLEGRIRADAGHAALTTSAGTEAPELAPVASQAEEMREFAAAVRGEGTVETPGEAGLWALAVCEAATLSAREGRTVQTAELPGAH
ncbi:MAG: Gfo/Idh/MocA family oxidoreductase [Armatimonadetes bacterium]|nr:Gfo/Idh/MocA family oxidoreductase [Armatimonadota bacterium]